LKGEITKSGGYFNDELDAGKRVNKLCEEMKIHPQNPAISNIPNQQYRKKEKISKYKGVYWHKSHKKWYVRVFLKGQKLKYGGSFKNELDAAKKVNQLCEDFGISQHNPDISTIPNVQVKKNSSQYKGVTYDIRCDKWYVQIHMKGEKKRYGGCFDSELDAGKRVNQLCGELGIPPFNPAISAIPANSQYQKKEKSSQYKGIYWHKQNGKWYVQLCLKDGSKKFFGMFKDELDAARRVNQLCEDIGIPLKNPEINALPKVKYQKRKKTSQYNKVSWHKETRKWRVQLRINDRTVIAGNFKNELDAANSVNQLEEELGILSQNPASSVIPNQLYQFQKKRKVITI